MHFNLAIIRFWTIHPALLYSLTFLLGFYCAFQWTPALLFPLFLIWLPLLFSAYQDFKCFKTLLLSILTFITACTYGISSIHFPSLPNEGVTGVAQIEIEALTQRSTYFGKQWMYHCRLCHFFPNHNPNVSIAQNIKCTVSLPCTPNLHRPAGNRNYLMSGILHQAENGSYFIKTKKDKSWLPLLNSWGLAEWRFQAKQKASKWIKKAFSHPQSGTFLAGLATGEFDDRVMQIEFARFGLQHIMAISGFHFSILAGILSFLLRFWFRQKIAALVILFLLSSYFLFLGCSSSILRAWMMISIAMYGSFLGKQANALNSLGLALIAVLLVDPLLCQSIGFQFSFLVTAAILIGYAPLDYFLSQILIKRPLGQVSRMDKWNQHGYCLLAFFRQGLALTIAVNLVALPVTLFYFNQFPLMSLFYNSFFPLFVSFAMFFMLMGLLIGLFFSPLGALIHTLNNIYTKWILNLIYNMPTSLDVVYRVESFSKEVTILLICLVFIGGIWAKSHLAEKFVEKKDLAFI